jgi:hypothetical protein
MDSMWIMSSEEFISEAVQNKSGKNAGSGFRSGSSEIVGRIVG